MLLRGLLFVLALSCLQGATAQINSDTMWVCRQDTGAEVLFQTVYFSDTNADNRGAFTMVDTGDRIAGYYVNFDYQFGKPSKGFAGFKMFWDYGVSSFWTVNYDSMVLWHKGPLPGHKVMMVWAQGSAGCGTPINYEYFGQFKSSAAWKRESFPFPEKRRYGSAPDSPFVKNGLFELRMLIYNDTSAGTVSDTSARGDLKLDNIYFCKKKTGIIAGTNPMHFTAGPNFFTPKTSGNVTLTIFSLKGEQLFKELVNVTAGKQYNVRQFALKNSKLPSEWIQCAQISGAGVNISAKLCR